MRGYLYLIHHSANVRQPREGSVQTLVKGHTPCFSRHGFTVHLTNGKSDESEGVCEMILGSHFSPLAQHLYQTLPCTVLCVWTRGGERTRPFFFINFFYPPGADGLVSGRHPYRLAN